MPEFTVKISTPSDLAGAKALEASLTGQIEAAQKMGKECDALEKKLMAVRTAITDYKGPVDDAGKGAEKLALSHRQLHIALEQISPALAGMARFLQSGFAGAVGGVLVVFGYLNEKLNEFQKYLADIDTGPGARGEWAEKIADNTRAAAVEMALFNEKLAFTAKAQESLEKITERVIRVQHEQATAEKQLGDAQKELALARLELDEKLGRLTPEQAVKIRLDIDDAAFKRQLEADKAAVQAELSARQNEARALAGQEPTLGATMDRAGAAALAAKNAADKNAEKLAQDKKNLADLEGKITAAETEQETIRNNPLISESSPRARRNQADLASLYNLRADYQRSQKAEEAKRTPLETAAALTKDEFDRAKAAYEEAAKSYTELERTLSDLEAKKAAVTARADALASIHAEISATRAAGAGPESLADTAARNAWSGTPAAEIDLSGARAALSNARTAAITHQPGAQDELHALLNQFIGLANDLHANAVTRGQFSELAQEVSNLRGQVNNSR